MKDEKYLCPKNEWRFVKIYTEVILGSDSSSHLLKEQTKDVAIPSKLFLMTLVLGVVSSLFYELPEFQYKNILNIILTVSVFGFFVSSLISLVVIGKQRKSLIQSLENKSFHTEEVVLYELTDEGIYINYFNKTNKEDMLFLRWVDVKSVSISYMIYKRFSYVGDRGYERAIYNLIKEFERANKEFSDFRYEPKRLVTDVRSIYFTMDNGRVSQLPVPPSWEGNGVALSLLDSIEFYCDEKEFVYE